MSELWNIYFDTAQPKDYSFLGFYEYRSKQADFTSVFKKESYKLKMDLANLKKYGSDEMKTSASKLDEARKVKLSVFSHHFHSSWQGDAYKALKCYTE